MDHVIMGVRRFEMTTGGHYKFWEVSLVEIAGVAHLVRHWGKIGTYGQDSKEPRLSKYKAADEMRKLIEEKLAKGYVEIGASPVSPVMSAETERAAAKALEQARRKAAKALERDDARATRPDLKLEAPKPMSVEDIRNKFRVKHEMLD